MKLLENLILSGMQPAFFFFNVIVVVFVMVDIKLTEKHRGEMFYCEVIFTALRSSQAENFQRISF